MSETLWLAMGKHAIMSSASGTVVFPCIQINGKNSEWSIRAGSIFLGPFKSEAAAYEAFESIKKKLNVVDSEIPEELWLRSKPKPKTISPEDYQKRQKELLNEPSTPNSFSFVVSGDNTESSRLIEDAEEPKEPEHPETLPDGGDGPGPDHVPPLGPHRGPR